MKPYALFAVAALLTTPVMAQSVGEKTGVNSTLGIAPTTADFVLQAAISDMFEVQSSELALERGDEKTKTFAKHMIDAHKKTSDELKTAAASTKVNIPSDLDSAHKDKLEKLRGLNGKEFVDQYQDEQEDAHENAVSLFQRYGDSGEDAELKSWAAKTRPALEEHLKMAEALDD